MAGLGGSVKLTGESEYRKALRQITQNLTEINSEMKIVNATYDKNDSSIKALNSRNTVLNKQLDEQNSKVSILSKALEEAKKEYGENSSQVQKLQTQLNNAQAEVIKTTREINNNTDSLKKFKKEEDNAGQGAITLGDLIKANLISDAIKSGFKGLVSAIKSVSSAMLDVGKSAIESYAEYEQLIGGVETLFKESSNVVQDYANNAYKTAGLSANEYMSTVTSFSASLLQSLNNDTAKSAEVANMAITDMSDNANKMGTDMATIQTAYQGFAKQNYTMLDNLKLGYGGTKSEMERLLKDATAISGVKYDISSLNDVYQAIHVIQGELGITGTTAQEASSTISGSVDAVKSSWLNLLTGIADENANFSELVNNFVDSIAIASENLIPRIGTVVEGLGKLVVSLAGKLVEQLPTLLATGKNMLQTLINGIVSMIPTLLPMVVDLIKTLCDFIVANLPTIIDAGIQILLSLVQGIADTLPELIPTVLDAVITIVENLLDNIDLIIDAGIQLIMGLADGLIEALPRLIDKIPVIIEKLLTALTTNLPKLTAMGIQLTVKLAVGLVQAIPQLVSKIPQIVTGIVNALKAGISSITEVGKNMVQGLWNGINNAKDWVLGKIKGFGNSVLKGIKSFFGIHSPSTVFRDEVGVYLAEGIGVGFEDGMKDVNESIQNSIPTEFDLGVKTSLSTDENGVLSYDTLVSAFTDALKTFKGDVFLDDAPVGKFVVKTVEGVIYS